jgi:PAS domain S-box-containing protein
LETYRAIFNAVNEGILVLDMQTGELVDANAVVCDLLGYTPEEASRLTVEDLSLDERPYTHKDALRWIHKAARGRPQRFDWLGKDRDGRLFWVDVTLKRATIAGQDRVLAIGRDITERKRGEEALRESEERFHKLSDAAFEGIVIHRKGTILEANQAFVAMLGYELSELTGMHILDVVAPESRDVVRQNALSGYPARYEFIGLRKDKTNLPVEGRGRAVPYQGRMARVAVVRDLTDRKQMEEALQKAREELEAKVEREMERGNRYGLTFRELTVLHLVAAGMADKEIGSQLGISPLTASKHLTNILSKMGAASRTEAGVRALKEGLLD